MNIRTAFVSLALVLASVPAFGQGNHGNANGNGGSNGAKDLSAAVADLQARVAKLEGNITPADLAGTYYVAVLSVQLSAAIASPPRNAAIETDMNSGILTLDAQGGGTFTLSSSNCGSAKLTQGPWTLDLQDCGAASQQVPATWTYANGTINVTFSDENETFPFVVAAGGRLWTLSAFAGHATDHSSDGFLIIVTRMQ